MIQAHVSSRQHLRSRSEVADVYPQSLLDTISKLALYFIGSIRVSSTTISSHPLVLITGGNEFIGYALLAGTLKAGGGDRFNISLHVSDS